ncbi:MAG: FAD-dependent oxidoreductase [Pleurocapsa minor GSE-CHR-MK-17-07R]|jgi:predicted NAD/FAD-dependent oxidoreductase|nr:FAD-dependent oxidoreductase [Pleurocapsa minor GSE-CHR-MK 17-07R]
MTEARATNAKWDITRAWNLPDVPPAPDDEPFDAYLRRIGFDDEALGYARRAWVNASGEAADRLSAIVCLQDLELRPSFSAPYFGDAPVPSAGNGDYRIAEGYLSLHDHLAAGLDIRLNTIVSEIDWSGPRAHVRTGDGHVFEADHVVVTLPLAVLKAGRVAFTPALPADKQDAIGRMNMAPALKLIYKFARPITPRGIAALYADGLPPMWWTPQANSAPDQEQVWLGFATGDHARDLLADGEAGALALGLETLRRELNQPALTPLEARIMNWTADEFALGGYSSVPPQGDGLREVLAAPVVGDRGSRLHFAGEATAPNLYAATVHGALVSGQRVARDILSVS